jgi:hypothetical protein
MKMARKKKNLINPLLATGREYCERSTPHGFTYWVTCTKISDRIFWVVTVMIGVACSTYFCKTAINDWIKSPTQTTINALGIPISQMHHPAITVCKENSVYDVVSTSGQCSTTFSLPAMTASLRRVAKPQLCLGTIIQNTQRCMSRQIITHYLTS